MALSIESILDGLVSHALSLGLFDRVGAHEPKSAPGKGLTAAFWVQDVMPSARQSGLDTTSIVLVYNARLYTSMLSEPQDSIDPNLVAALDTLLGAYSGDFTLNGQVMAVDLLGMSGGKGLSAQAGYLTQDGSTYRVFTVTIPMVVTDLWGQAP